METIFRLPDHSRDELDQFRQEVDRLKSGAISAAEFRAYRVPRGIYEQREAETYMLRVRLPAGAVLPHQMRTLAGVSRRYGNGILHITTRQDLQVHRVLLDDIHPALVELHAAGLSTKGGGGNTVRNMTGCCDAGVCAQEAFDVSPYVIALTEFMLPDPLSYQLPRKYKIAFSGCPRDCAGATINDLGFIAGRQGEALGFAVYVGGGMGASSRVGSLLESFVPAHEIHRVAEAIKRVFDKHGNRRNRNKARIRFLVEQIGLARFTELYRQELDGLRETGDRPLEIREMPACPPPGEVTESDPAFGVQRWRSRHATAQKQSGYFLVDLPVWLGEIAADKLENLAGIVERYGERAARATQRQTIVLRWIHEKELASLYSELTALGLAGEPSRLLGNLVACTGASTCRLGICLSRGLAEAIRKTLSEGGLDLDALAAIKINISGCPNACGRHPVGDIGLFGAARRAHGRLVPHYVLQLGGTVEQGQTRLAEGNDAVPAKHVPALVEQLLGAFRNSSHYPDFKRFLANEGRGAAASLAARHGPVPDLTVNRDYYYDWGAAEMFSLAGRGPGECGAGVFDLIEVDLDNAVEAIRRQQYFEATVLASRALLVTKGQQAQNATESLDLFTQFFLDEKLVDASLAEVVRQARQAAQSPSPEKSFTVLPGEAARLVEAVRGLYASMDASLRFKPAVQEPPATTAAAPAELPKADREADFRGVTCPLNYVKTKLLLGQMQPGAVLSVLLDEPGARNVPSSVEKDGHEVLLVAEEGDRWRVLIRKG
ncbi:MAG: sulfurtransferase TusA family protein [Pirellulales bacterium]